MDQHEKTVKMVKFKTNIEVIPAIDEEIELYYETASRKINSLLEKYDIRNARGELEEVSADKLRNLLSSTDFLQATPLKSIFFDKKQQFVPEEVVYEFRKIISNPPISIKVIIYDTFLTLLENKGWVESLGVYFEKHYRVPHGAVIILDDLKDFSLGFGIYRATFQLRTPNRERVSIFFKRSYNLRSHNELLYSQLQQELLPTASYAKMPCLIVNKENNEEVIISPLNAGIASETVLSLFVQAYRKAQHDDQKCSLKKSIEIIIEAFISHAVLGDLLLRNDRHLMNSLIDFVVDGKLQRISLEDLKDSEKILTYADIIVKKKCEAISLIDIDLKWLLGEKNSGWILADIDFGLSELNLLSLLDEFNDYNAESNTFFEARKKYIDRYTNQYCRQQEAILENKKMLFSSVEQIYPASVSGIKLKLLSQRIEFFEKDKGYFVELIRRYLLDFRIRLAYKETLYALGAIAGETNEMHLLNALKDAGLLRYLPSRMSYVSKDLSVFLKLQCFRGVLSNKDAVLSSETDTTTWEIVASAIEMVAEKFNTNLFRCLRDKIQFIEKDTAALLESCRDICEKSKFMDNSRSDSQLWNPLAY